MSNRVHKYHAEKHDMTICGKSTVLYALSRDDEDEEIVATKGLKLSMTKDWVQITCKICAHRAPFQPYDQLNNILTELQKYTPVWYLSRYFYGGGEEYWLVKDRGLNYLGRGSTPVEAVREAIQKLRTRR